MDVTGYLSPVFLLDERPRLVLLLCCYYDYSTTTKILLHWITQVVVWALGRSTFIRGFDLAQAQLATEHAVPPRLERFCRATYLATRRKWAPMEGHDTSAIPLAVTDIAGPNWSAFHKHYTKYCFSESLCYIGVITSSTGTTNCPLLHAIIHLHCKSLQMPLIMLTVP